MLPLAVFDAQGPDKDRGTVQALGAARNTLRIKRLPSKIISMECEYFRKGHKPGFVGICESPEGPLLNDIKSSIYHAFCEGDFVICSYYRAAQTDCSRFLQAMLSRKLKPV